MGYCPHGFILAQFYLLPLVFETRCLSTLLEFNPGASEMSSYLNFSHPLEKAARLHPRREWG